MRGAEVHAIHVREAPCHNCASYAMPAASEPEGGASVAEMWQSMLAGTVPGVTVRTETAVGLVARVLLDRCQGADMLVLGTAGDIPDAMWSAGPVIRACLRWAPCPVVVISAALESAQGGDRAGTPEQAGVPAGSVPASATAGDAAATAAGPAGTVAPKRKVPVAAGAS